MIAKQDDPKSEYKCPADDKQFSLDKKFTFYNIDYEMERTGRPCSLQPIDHETLAWNTKN